MSYEAAVLVSILRSLLAGFICTGLGRVLVAWRVGSGSCGVDSVGDGG